MSAGIGITAQAAQIASVLAITTASATTQATGSDLYVVAFGVGANAASAPTITDNMGNSAKYVAIGTQFQNTNLLYAWRFVAPNIAGGAGHTVTATYAAAPSVLGLFIAEATGCALTSPVDQSNTGTSGASTGPSTTGNITVTPPASGDVLFGVVFVTDGSGSLTFTEANGFTIQQVYNITTNSVQAALGTKIVAAGTYSAAYSWGGANIFTGSFIDSFKGAASGGGGTLYGSSVQYATGGTKAFNPQGNTFLVTTNATPSTASAQLVSFNPSTQPTAQASGLQNCPPQVLIENLGTAIVYVSFTSALRTALVPAANPSLELPVFPGVSRVFTLPQTPNAQSATPYALQINTISGTASQPLLVTFGEGS